MLEDLQHHNLSYAFLTLGIIILPCKFLDCFLASAPIIKIQDIFCLPGPVDTLMSQSEWILLPVKITHFVVHLAGVNFPVIWSGQFAPSGRETFLRR